MNLPLKGKIQYQWLKWKAEMVNDKPLIDVVNRVINHSGWPPRKLVPEVVLREQLFFTHFFYHRQDMLLKHVRMFRDIEGIYIEFDNWGIKLECGQYSVEIRAPRTYDQVGVLLEMLRAVSESQGKEIFSCPQTDAVANCVKILREQWRRCLQHETDRDTLMKEVMLAGYPIAVIDGIPTVALRFNHWIEMETTAHA